MVFINDPFIERKELCMKNIILIGPVYPYKGGISHYTGLMYKALKKKFIVKMISYKMQYPKFLYKREQKDYSNDQFKIDDTYYWLNTANPFNCILIGKKLLKMNPDLVILQWWHPYFAPCYWLLEKVLKRNVKILLICHNVFPHERFPADRFLTKLVVKNANYYIVQSKQDEKDLLSINNNAIFKRTVHPTYNVFKIQNMDKATARKKIGLFEEQKVLLFFGFVREYKGLKYLLRAIPQVLQQMQNVKLLVVGDFDGDKDQYIDIVEKNKIREVVDIYDGYIPDQEVEKFFAACDLVVLPYESATQSGIIQIAYGFEKPVIATAVGGLPEVVEDGKTGYIVPPKDSSEIANAICRFFLEKKEEEFAKEIKKEAYKYSWDRMTQIIDEFIEIG